VDPSSVIERPLALPARLAPYADPARVRGLYPVALLAEPTRPAAPLIELLPELLDAGGSILRDNLVRWETYVRARVPDDGSTVGAVAVLAAAGEAMVADLALSEGPAAELGAQLASAVGRVAEGTVLAGYAPGVGLRLLRHVAGPGRLSARSAWRTTVHGARNRVAGLLAVERARSPEGSGASAVASAVGGFGASLVDPAKLARVVGPARGGRRMDDARRHRLEVLLATLDRALAAPEAPALVVIGAALEAPDVVSVRSSDPCADAASRFDALAAELVRVSAAVQAVELECEGGWDDAVHGARAAALDWRHLDERELATLPVVVAVVDAERVVHDDMVSLTRLLGSGRPVQVLVDVQSTRNPGAGEDDPLGGFRVELGQLGMSLRQAVVHQGTPADPVRCVVGLAAAVDGGRAGLHLLCSGFLPWEQQSAVGAWLTASSAVDSRAHPLFLYDPDRGESWADCLDASANPAPERDWVEEADSAFTFADHALLDPSLAAHFEPLGPAHAEHALALAEWLALDGDAADSWAPVVSSVVGGEAAPLVVSEALAFACRDRLRSWRSLRELAGYSNKHVESAVARVREEERAAAAAERAALESAHAEELERVRAEAAAEAIGRLAAALVDADWSAGGSVPARAPTPVAAPGAVAEPVAAPVVVASEPEPEPEPEPDEPASEAWIDSVLCTSCNDCVNLNGQLFAYDANKQAFIKDASAGTFEELVRAAEACPARCIHPGEPLNPQEPNLAELVARAARFG
jgi:ferredoxin